MNIKRLPEKLSVDDFDLYEDSNLTYDEIHELIAYHKENIQLLPLPAGALKNGALLVDVLPYILSELNNACDFALNLQKTEDEEKKKDNHMLDYEIRTVYLECLFSFKQNNINKNNNASMIACMNVISKKMDQLGLDAKKLRNNLNMLLKTINTQFFAKLTDTGEKVLISKGVLIKSFFDEAAIDSLYLHDGIEENLLKAGEMNVLNDSYDCFVLNPMFSDRIALDFATVENNDAFFEMLYYMEHLKKASPELNQKILEKTEFYDDKQEPIQNFLKK